MTINRLIAEATVCDFKESLETKKPRSWLKSVSAYANGIGGTLFFGVQDNGNIIGIDYIQKDSEEISRLIKERIVPVPKFNLIVENEKDKDYIALVVSSGNQTPYYYKADGKMETFSRVGNESVIAPDYLLKELILKGSHQSYDSVITNLPKSDYSFTLLEATYKERTGIRFESSDYISFGLADKDGYLTNAGKLLIDQHVTFNSRIFCTRWNGLDKGSIFDDAIDDKEYEGNLIYLMKSACDFIKNNSKVRFVKEATKRIDKLDYSERAYLEAIVNALIHRDYIIMGKEIHIDMYDDRLEIVSPGGMYEGKLIQDIDIDNVSSTRRNPVIADLFHRLRLMERRGSGLKKILESTKNLPGYNEEMKPVFISSDNDFYVKLKNINYLPAGDVDSTVQDTGHDTGHDTVTADKRKMLVEFCSSPKSRAEMQSYIGISSREHFRINYLKPLVASGKLMMTKPDKPQSINQKYVSNINVDDK